MYKLFVYFKLDKRIKRNTIEESILIFIKMKYVMSFSIRKLISLILSGLPRRTVAKWGGLS